MGGSSKSQPKPTPIQPTDTSYYSVPPVQQTVQPLAPGHLDLIAAQIARGYGGTANSYRNHMSDVYKPVEIPDYPAAHRAVAATNAAAAAAPPPPTSAPVPASNLTPNLFVYDSGNWRGGPY